jgi:hypothetical protein
VLIGWCENLLHAKAAGRKENFDFCFLRTVRGINPGALKKTITQTPRRHRVLQRKSYKSVNPSNPGPDNYFPQKHA